MVVSILAVKNKPSKRGEDEIERGNSSEKQENSRPVIERIPPIAIFSPPPPTDELTDYFSSRNYHARDA